MTSLWLSRNRTIDTDAFAPGLEVDELVVGAGITGLVTALLFAREGRRVAVVEARTVAAGATGNTTAKLSLLQGTQLQRIRSHGYPAVVRAYVEGNRAAQAWLLDYARSRGVQIERRDALTYAATPDGFRAVEREFRVARSAGLDARLTRRTDLPFANYGAVVLKDQAQFDPVELLAQLVRDIRDAGGVVLENTRVTGVAASKPVRVITERGELTAQRVYLATGVPVLDRGLYFAKVEAKRSLAASFRVDAPLPQGMYLSAERPSRSLRTARDGDSEVLLVGGNGHGVGRARSEARLLDELIDWTQERFPGASLSHSWSAQDYSTPHGVPFVGWLPRGRGRVYLATGFDKWGMTNGIAAALTLTGDVLGATPAWARTLHRRATTPVAMASGIGSNAAVAWWAAKGWVKTLTGPVAPEKIAESQGVVGRRGAHPVAVSTVDGTTCAVSGVCSHLGGIVTWNDVERSWDCPLHGSRFGADGAVLEGPATAGLARLRASR